MQDVGQPPVEQQHGEAMHQRPRPRDGGPLFQGQRLLRDLFVTTRGDCLCKTRKRCFGRLM